MKIRVLGCDGGIGDARMRTTSLQVDESILIDAGTGVADLAIEALLKIDHVFLTHSHLDHIVMLPFLVDSVNPLRDKPLTVYAQKETLNALREHIFNWKIWPDFAEISLKDTAVMQYREIKAGEKITLGPWAISTLPAAHIVPTVGYLLDSGEKSLAFTGDTGPNDALWSALNKVDNLRYLLIETTFFNQEKQRAIRSKHLCPDMLADELKRLKHKNAVELYICHFKSPHAELMMNEILACVDGGIQPRPLVNGHTFEF